MSLPSLTRQCQLALRSLLRIGHSKKAAKEDGTLKDSIFTWGVYRKYLDCSCRFARWARARYGLRLLKDATEEMGRAFLQSLLNEQLSPRTVRVYRAALRKLERGVLRRFGVRVKIVPDDFLLPPCRVTDRRAGAYDPDEVQALLSMVGPPEGDVLRVQVLLGLRVSEAVRLRAGDFDLPACVRVKGKGGLVRHVQVPPAALPFLSALIRGRSPEEKLFPSLRPEHVQRRLTQACRALGIPGRGTHGFRHTYAQELHAELMAGGLTDREARSEVSFRLGHRRVAITYAYVPPLFWPQRRASAYDSSASSRELP